MGTPGWRFMLLDNQDRPLDESLDGVTGGGGEIVALSALGGSAQVVIDDLRARGWMPEIDWGKHRIRALYTDGEQEWPFGTYLLTSPKEQHTSTGLTWQVNLLTKMNVPQEQKLTSRLTVPVGAAIIPTVVDLIHSTGETRIAVTDSDVTATSVRTYEANTPLLKVINELLTAVGYWSLWCDGGGTYRVEPYVNPDARPVRASFKYGETSLYLPGWSFERDMTSVPNRFVAVGVGDEETEPLRGVATNTDPNSPFSYQARGNRWIDAGEDGVEAESQDIIDQYAARKLREAMDPVGRFSIAHRMRDLNPHDLVSFTPKDGVRRRATVQRMAVDFRWDTDMRAEWRAVQ